MSEIALSNATNYNYSNGPMVSNMGSELVEKSGFSPSTAPVASYEDTSQQQTQYASYPAYAFQQMPAMGYSPMPDYSSSADAMSRLGYFNDAPRQQPNSPGSISSSTSSLTPSPSPHATSSYPNTNGPVLTPQQSMKNSTAGAHEITSRNNNGSKATQNGRFNNPTTARVKEMITRANSVPMEFYQTEFLEYSKETYEKKTGKKLSTSNNKRKGMNNSHDDVQVAQDNAKKQKKWVEQQKDMESEDEDIGEDSEEYLKFKFDDNLSSAEIRRQIHIQSEQKRRAQIKDGFDELRKHLPGCNNKKMSKAALLTRTVQQLQHLKGMQTELLSEVERLLQENESLKKFQHGVLQRQAMEKMYTF